MNVAAEQWTAGVQYLVSLFTALRTLSPEARPEVWLLLNERCPTVPESLRPFVDGTLVEPRCASVTRKPLWQRAWRAAGRRIRNLARPVSPLGGFLREHAVDAVFANTDFGPELGVPLLVWIPDFQARHLPELFAEEERRTLEACRRNMARYADRVVLSSETVRRDFVAFAPEAAERARVVPFVVPIPEAAYTADPAAVARRYHLPERFFYLPNQFWKHKNHGLVIEALSRLRGEHPDLTVVCSGNLNEYRDPRYVGELLARIAVAGLRERMIVLGLVPREDVLALMRQSVAVLQPSLFEGWSTTVEEAKSLGKALVLSDISTHREQAPPAAVYFDPRDPAALVRVLGEIWRTRAAGPDPTLETAARAVLPERLRRFAEAFMQVVAEAGSGKREAGSGKREAGSGKREAGSGKREETSGYGRQRGNG